MQGSLARSVGAWESWVRPLADGSFAAVVLNKVRKIITFFEPFLYGKRAFVKTGSGQTQEKLRKHTFMQGAGVRSGRATQAKAVNKAHNASMLRPMSLCIN